MVRPSSFVASRVLSVACLHAVLRLISVGNERSGAFVRKTRVTSSLCLRLCFRRRQVFGQRTVLTVPLNCVSLCVRQTRDSGSSRELLFLTQDPVCPQDPRES